MVIGQQRIVTWQSVCESIHLSVLACPWWSGEGCACALCTSDSGDRRATGGRVYYFTHGGGSGPGGAPTRDPCTVLLMSRCHCTAALQVQSMMSRRGRRGFQFLIRFKFKQVGGSQKTEDDIHCKLFSNVRSSSSHLVTSVPYKLHHSV